MSVAFRFTLYVSGAGPASITGEAHFRRLCEERLDQGTYEITVVDVLADVARSDADRILVTPTVVRTEPLPEVRVIGDLSATLKMAEVLGFPIPRGQ